MLDQFDVDWSRDLMVNFSYVWDWQGDNVTFTYYRESKTPEMFTTTLEGDRKVEHTPEKWDWPDDRPQILVRISVEGDWYNGYLGPDDLGLCDL